MNALVGSIPAPIAGCPTSRSFFARCGIPQVSPSSCHGPHCSTGVPHVRSSVRGPKTMGEAHHSFSFRTLPFFHWERGEVERSLCERSFLEMFSTEESRAFGQAFGPPKVMKNGSCSATTVDGGTALPFVISTGAQWRDLCVDAVSWECFSNESRGPARDEKNQTCKELQQTAAIVTT
jgi:hypothetical protein